MSQSKKYKYGNMKQFKQMIKESKLRDLPRHLAKIEKRIYNLVRQKEHRQSCCFRKMKLKRNTVRNALLEKLIAWQQDPTSEEIISYSEVLEREEQKILEENYEKPQED